MERLKTEIIKAAQLTQSAECGLSLDSRLTQCRLLPALYVTLQQTPGCAHKAEVTQPGRLPGCQSGSGRTDAAGSNPLIGNPFQRLTEIKLAQPLQGRQLLFDPALLAGLDKLVELLPGATAQPAKKLLPLLTQLLRQWERGLPDLPLLLLGEVLPGLELLLQERHLFGKYRARIGGGLGTAKQ